MGLSVPPAQLVYPPNFEPALTTSAIFLILVLCVLWRWRQQKFQVYTYLLVFTIIRVIAYAFRAAWAKDLHNLGIFLTSIILINGSQFLMLTSIYLALYNWASKQLQAIGDEVSLDRTRFVKLAIVGLAIFQVINIIASLVLLLTLQPSLDLIDSVDKCHQAATIGFLCMIVIYCLMVSIYYTRFAKSKALPRQYKVLLAIGIMLFVRYSYKVALLYYTVTDIIQDETYYYMLDPIVEMFVLIVATSFDMEEIRFVKSNDVEAPESNDNEMAAAAI